VLTGAASIVTLSVYIATPTNGELDCTGSSSHRLKNPFSNNSYTTCRLVVTVREVSMSMEQFREDLSLALVAHLQNACHWMELAAGAWPRPHHCRCPQ